MAAKVKKGARKAAPRKRAGRLGPAAVKRGLTSAEILLNVDDPLLAEVVAAVRKADGSTIGAYREPLAGRPLLLASLPFSAIEPTPFQRDLSPTHAKRLAAAIESTGAFLDPLIVVPGRRGPILDAQRSPPTRRRQGARV